MHSRLGALLLITLVGSIAPAEDRVDVQTKELTEAIHALQLEVRELRMTVSDLRSESVRYRAEMERLREQVANARAAYNPVSPSTEQAATPAQLPEQRLEAVEEQQRLLSARIEEQHQTKVESASKYHVRLSGIVLMNAFSNGGSVDNLDVPTIATPRLAYDARGSVGATLRQSQIGLEAFGPIVGGAKTSAELQFDFAGGFPSTYNGVATGLVRLRTGSLRLDWDRTSLVVGQDRLFLSPLTPTSFASLATPALSYSGNLWGWIPQVRIEERMPVAEHSRVVWQAGILDPLDGEFPLAQSYRYPQAGERSRMPGYGTRLAWTQTALSRNFTLGAGGYYSRQDWGFDRNINAWAGMMDWDLPMLSWLTLSGEFYRGNAIGGFGGGVGRSVLSSGPQSSPSAIFRGLNTIGGWGQVKIKAAPKLEFNAAAGQDNPFASEVRAFPPTASYVGQLVRNRTVFANAVYRPRSDLVFSLEFRRLRTFDIFTDAEHANQVNLAMGFLF